MRNLTKKQSGFTLIEIIVVLIILGVLAAIALPSLFSNINRSRGAEALASLNAYKSMLVGCMQGHAGNESDYCRNGGSSSLTFANTANFSYAQSNLSNGQIDQWTLTATGRNKLVSTDTITMSATSSGVVCTGASALAGIC